VLEILSALCGFVMLIVLFHFCHGISSLNPTVRYPIPYRGTIYLLQLIISLLSHHLSDFQILLI
jgi:hypothetical protein